VTSLTAIFGSSPGKTEEESEKLLNLYWNRAELKKEFAELRKEQLRLQEAVKQQQGVTARVQQKLEHLEHLLLDPEWVNSVVVYYQFRVLNLRCRAKLEKFAEQLKQQREQREHQRLLAEWKKVNAGEAAVVEERLGEQRLEVQMLEDRLQHERRRIASLSGLAKMFRGRSATAALDELAASIEAAQREEQALLKEHDEIVNSEPPDTRGLDISTKRLINFMILAFAQQLYLHFRDDNIATMAKEAADKSVGSINYGSKADCDELIGRIQRRLEKFEKAANLADVLQQRAKRIADGARFRALDDAVPVEDSVVTIYRIGPGGATSTLEANLLGENYWNLSEVVSR